MTRLTTSIRTAIANKAVAHAFDPRQAALIEAEEALAREVHAFLFPAAEIEQVEKLPERWIVRDSCLLINAAGYRVTLKTSAPGLPVPAAGAGYCHRHDLPHGELAERVQAHAYAKEALKQERQKANDQTLAMLGRVTTIKRLKEVWPEGQPFYAAYENAPPAGLPAVRMDEINAMLGLAA